MIWLYLGWLVLLTGANIAYYHQHPERLKWDNEKRSLSGRLQEQSMLSIMLALAKSHAQKDSNEMTVEYLSKQLVMPDETVLLMINLLAQGGFVKSSDDDPTQYFPAQSIELIRVVDIINCAHQGSLENDSISTDPIVANIMLQHQSALNDAFLNTNFASLISTP
jgi:membrane protein